MIPLPTTSTDPAGSNAASRAAQATAAYQWAEAITHYNTALIQPDLPPLMAYALHSGRAWAYRYEGHFQAALADLDRMMHLAEVMGDRARQAEALTRQIEPLRIAGDLTRAQARAEAALQRAAGYPPLVAAAQYALSRVLEWQGEFAAAQLAVEQAQQLYVALGDPQGEAYCLMQLAVLAGCQGAQTEALAALVNPLARFRQLGDRWGEAMALLFMGLSSPDAVQRRACHEQSLQLFQAVGDRISATNQADNLAWVYWQSGLYSQAGVYADQVLQNAHAMRSGWLTADGLCSMGMSALALGKLAQAEAAFADSLSQLRAMGRRSFEPWALLGLGWVALARHQHSTAAEMFAAAATLSATVGMAGEQATALAWQGATALAQAQPAPTAADTYTAQAVAILQQGAVTSLLCPAQEVWWWRYQALRAMAPATSTQFTATTSNAVVPQAGVNSSEAAVALERACQLMLAYVASVSDEGLRRNYLSKVAINREITLIWSRQAAAQGRSLAPFTERESGSNLHDQLQRMLSIGVRLSQQRNPEALPRFILDEFVELCGAERALLLLADDAGSELRLVLTNDLDETAGSQAQALAQPLLAQVRQQRLARVIAQLGDAPPDDLAVLHLRSALAVPLLAQGKLLGILYGDMRHIFGCFTTADLDLLTVLANQAAAALENANWTRTLEQRVAERTAALAQAVQATEREKRYFEALLVNSPVAVVTIDPAQHIVSWNPAAETLFGYSETEAIGHNIDDLIALTEEMQREVWAQTQTLPQTPEAVRMIARRHRKDGTLVDVEGIAVPIFIEGAQASHFLIYHDITELQRRTEEVRQLNAQLDAENRRLGTELAVARHLQQLLQPQPVELQQAATLDIAGYMQPADEVGGDYYDILHHPGGVKISIGDVTDHGLTSGVIMLMTQTAVRTLLTSGERDPVRFLDVLNRTIYGNLQRIQATHTLSLALLDYQADQHQRGEGQAGQVRISGQHEEVLLVRRNGLVERIATATLGFPIGLIEDASAFFNATTLALAPGDGIVLYTDGIPEAESEAGELYGMARLCAVVRRHWDESAELIKQQVIADVMRHIGRQKIYDDLTLLVIKQR